ncbi:hypothetical protein JRO89_XS01G0063400 [Xanthoceras sorbifolium]|uniref:DNA (cytosine-5-)-methyltransferase n=1 Tax=Xanthoceras sorbifolium TaxID=99658 RepID=A0ABQ8IIN0_9ROSI|nr:hypothetical protein JRO89_XS01G0063400 [Xanthoceras sorbifolium]
MEKITLGFNGFIELKILSVMQEAATFHDSKRLFYSTVMNDNPVDCIISKVSITQIPPTRSFKSNSITNSGFYFDMEYCVEYSTFRTLPSDNSLEIHDLLLPHSIKNVPTAATAHSLQNMHNSETYKAELVLLDLYSGCGGMSTGLCLGAKLSCINLVTKWAVDIDKSACESLRLNHPETRVLNEKAEEFLQLLKEWQKLCKRYVVNNVKREHRSASVAASVERNNVTSTRGADTPNGEYEVASLVDVCYGDPNKTGKRSLNFKVHWKGYSSSEDTWEPIEGLSNCQERIQDFVRAGYKSKILPLPGDVDVICGGPPCQGISGYNRFRNVNSPLDDERNRQIIVFMDIVEFLKPMFVLMENVVDILRFDKASLGRYALSRLVHMKYQARLGIIAAGCYGLPQFRLRVFLWGAHHNVKLPQFPLPTHDVIVRYWPPPEFERNTVAYDEDQPRDLEKAVVLQDAISDLPTVTSHEAQEEMSYTKPPETEFQRFMRSSESGKTVICQLKAINRISVSLLEFMSGVTVCELALGASYGEKEYGEKEHGENEFDAMVKTISDHCPILLDTCHRKWGPIPFRFENAWLEHHLFLNNVEEWWNEADFQGWKGFSNLYEEAGMG